MLGTRYEEHTHFTENLPIKFVPDILITPTTRRDEANWHENLELKLCTNGCGSVMLDEKDIPFKKDEIIVINSNVLHHTNSDTSLTYTALLIDSEFCRQIEIDPHKINFTEKITDTSFLELLKTLSDIYGDKTNKLRTAKIYEATIKLLITLKENYALSQNNNKFQNSSFESIKNAIKYIRENYDKKLSLDEIAQNVFMDKFVLSREFKKITNQTIVHYINNLRCQNAAKLISGGHSVSDSARLCGFTNMSFFTKTFLKHMGNLPSDYRKKQ